MTIAQMQQFRDAGIAGIVEEVAKAFPLVTRTNVIEVKGNIINVPAITKDIEGVFRPAYTGKTGGYESETRPVNLSFCDASWFIDEQVVRSDPQGIDASASRAASSAIRGAMFALEKAAFNGVGTDGATFKGLNQAITDANVVDAGGSGDVTDCYILNDNAVSLFVGGGGLFEAGEIVKSQISDADGKIYWAYGQNLSWYAALCAVNTFGIARVKNISKTNKLTDDLVFEAMSRLDASFAPTAIYMSPTGVRQLQISRTATSITGAPAPIPVDVSGVPVYITSAISVLR